MALAEAIQMLEKARQTAYSGGRGGVYCSAYPLFKSKDKLSNTIKYAYICNSALEIIEDELAIEIDRKSIGLRRFTSHVRYAVERISKKPSKTNCWPRLSRPIRTPIVWQKWWAAMMAGGAICECPRGRNRLPCAIHIERLKNAIDN